MLIHPVKYPIDSVPETRDAPPAPIPGGEWWRPWIQNWVIVLAAFVLLIAIIQRSAGASSVAFGGFPDESPHYVGGVLIHDYLVGAFGKDPIHFVREYYIHRPFFALGVWPPFFYFLEGCWMAVFGAQRQSILWMIAVAGAGLATLLYWLLRRHLNHWGAAAGGALFLFVPVVQWSACLVMVDLMCSLLGLIAILFFARFMERQRWQDSLLFGFFCGLALLTKNSTYFVLLIPPIVIAAARRWELLRRPALWLAPVVVMAMYLPWLLVSRSVLLLGIHGLELPGVVGIHRDYFVTLWHEMSFLLPLGALGGAWSMVSKGPKLSAITMCMLAVIPALSIGIFVARVPVQDRLLMLAYVAVIYLVGECWAAVWPSKRTAMMAGCLVVFAAMNWMHFDKLPADHIRNPVAFLEAHDGNQPGAVLTPSDSEGPWIAEFAESEAKRPMRMLVRPTKLFGKEDWNGSNWKPYYTTADEIQRLLERMPLKYCILSKSPSGRRYPHDALLETVVAKDPQNWQLIFTTKPENGLELRIYQNLHWQPESERMVYGEVSRVMGKYLR